MPKCHRCGKDNPPEQSKKSRILFRSRKQVFDGRKGCYVHKAYVAEEVFDFCKDGPCAAHEQMSREG